MTNIWDEQKTDKINLWAILLDVMAFLVIVRTSLFNQGIIDQSMHKCVHKII